MSQLSKNDFTLTKVEALLLYRNLLVLRGAFLELTENQKVFETTEELKALAGMTQSLIDVMLKPLKQELEKEILKKEINDETINLH